MFGYDNSPLSNMFPRDGGIYHLMHFNAPSIMWHDFHQTSDGKKHRPIPAHLSDQTVRGKIRFLPFLRSVYGILTHIYTKKLDVNIPYMHPMILYMTLVRIPSQH